MGIIINIVERLKNRLADKKAPIPPRHDDAFYDTAGAPEEDTVGNPIIDLYNRAVTHPVATIGLLAAAVGVGAAIAFAVAEQRAQRGIERELAREGKRTSKKLRAWSDEEIVPRFKNYRRKYGKRLSRWSGR